MTSSVKLGLDLQISIRLRIEHLPCNFFENRAGHFYEILSTGTCQNAAFAFGRDIPLNEDVVAIGQDHSGASGAVTQSRCLPIFAKYL